MLTSAHAVDQAIADVNLLAADVKGFGSGFDFVGVFLAKSSFAWIRYSCRGRFVEHGERIRLSPNDSTLPRHFSMLALGDAKLSSLSLGRSRQG